MKEKRRFYETFALLEQDDDETDEVLPAKKASVRKDGAVTKKSTAERHHESSSLQPMRRSVSDSNTILRPSTGLGPRNMAAQKITPAAPGLVRATTDIYDRPPPGAIPRPLKAKGKQVIDLVPEQRRVFRDCHFFFFPNDDISPTRQRRIIKAIEYGGSWQRNWNTFITHIIVDQGLSYQALLRYLKFDSIPSRVGVVNDIWLPECIDAGVLVNPFSLRFRLMGAPTTIAPQPEHDVEQGQPESDTSLKLKPAGRAVQARPPSTQSTPRTTRHQQQANNEQSVRTEDEPPYSALGPAPTNPEFELAISQAKQLPFLSFDDEEPDSDVTKIEQNQVEHAGRKINTNNFQCMQAHTGDTSGLANAETIAILEQMAEYYTSIRDHWRQRAYRKGIAMLRHHPTKIMTREDALALPHIGVRLAEKIEEIATTHRLRRLETAQNEPQDRALQLFLGIYGVGTVQANKWIQEGHRSLEDLRNAKLTKPQSVGLEHYDDFNARIPRDEVKQHGDIVLAALQYEDSAFELTVGGSYRRGAMTSGDIDCIITHPRHSLRRMTAIIHGKVIPRLGRINFIKEELATSSSATGSKWLGASCLPDSTIWRRIDFLFVPVGEIGAAMIYFTGNDIFNRSIRLLASKKGYRLNQKGLFKDVAVGKNRERLSDGTLVEGRSEKKIFEILGVPWREPHERVI